MCPVMSRTQVFVMFQISTSAAAFLVCATEESAPTPLAAMFAPVRAATSPAPMAPDAWVSLADVSFSVSHASTSSPSGYPKASHLAGKFPPSLCHASCEWSSDERTWPADLRSPCSNQQSCTHYWSLAALICSNGSVPLTPLYTHTVTHIYLILHWHVPWNSARC